jgi:hypothetical protein
MFSCVLNIYEKIIDIPLKVGKKCGNFKGVFMYGEK